MKQRRIKIKAEMILINSVCANNTDQILGTRIVRGVRLPVWTQIIDGLHDIIFLNFKYEKS
jgi:hypothetical protein